jgi:hypothetical protein
LLRQERLRELREPVDGDFQVSIAQAGFQPKRKINGKVERVMRAIKSAYGTVADGASGGSIET